MGLRVDLLDQHSQVDADELLAKRNAEEADTSAFEDEETETVFDEADGTFEDNMNIQDIADFIDLVKNPVKYEKALQNLKEEQQRLNAVVETVGKASELEALRKKVLEDQAKLEQDLKSKIEANEKKTLAKLKSLEATQVKAQEELDKAQKAQVEAQLKQISAEELQASFSGRDKQIRKQEEELSQRLATIQSKEAELAERLAKLRSVMG